MNKTLADDLREMMAAWNTIQSAARAQFPGASDEQIHKITSGAMEHSLGMTAVRS